MTDELLAKPAIVQPCAPLEEAAPGASSTKIDLVLLAGEPLYACITSDTMKLSSAHTPTQ